MAEGATTQIEVIVERLKELATSAASQNVDSDGRARLNDEAGKLFAEIDRIATDAKYGTQSLVSATINLTFQVGSGSTTTQDQINVSTTAGLLASTLGPAGGLSALNMTSLVSVQAALTSIDASLVSINVVQGQIGAAQSRFEFAGVNLAVSIENIMASESIIRDVDMAFEMVSFTRNQILLQAGTAMLAQANMIPQNVLSLLGGR